MLVDPPQPLHVLIGSEFTMNGRVVTMQNGGGETNKKKFWRRNFVSSRFWGSSLLVLVSLKIFLFTGLAHWGYAHIILYSPFFALGEWPLRREVPNQRE